MRMMQAAMRSAGRGILAVALAVGSPLPAHAVLGGDAASVEADRAAMGAAGVLTTPGALYTVHELQAASGTTVREYALPTGRVFAVAWSGPFMPDLRQLLGPHFDTYTEAAKAQQAGAGRIDVRQSGLVVQSGGRMRAFFGRAYLPAALPAGMAVDEIR